MNRLSVSLCDYMDMCVCVCVCVYSRYIYVYVHIRMGMCTSFCFHYWPPTVKNLGSQVLSELTPGPGCEFKRQCNVWES